MKLLRVRLRQGTRIEGPGIPDGRMLRHILLRVFPVLVACAVPVSARAQTPQSQISGCRTTLLTGATQESLTKEIEGKNEKVMLLTGSGALSVRVDCDDSQFFAEYVEVFPDRHQIVATRNVTVVSSSSRISAERAVFDTKTKLGVFYNADGWANLGDRVDRSMFGTQEPDARFRGKEIHKIGPKKYKIVDGAFSTCVQPTPRWEIVTGTATLELDNYAFLRNSVLRVKGVPLMYMPMFYYPIQEDDRATGFLIPIYGTSTFRGQSWSFPFFWAISRSQDATIEYDWFSKAGQQVGSEYRYVIGPGAQGNANVSLFNEKASQPTTGGAATAGGRSYRVDGSMVQPLFGGLRAQARADYFSKATTEQLYQQDVYRATQSTRAFGGNISGNWREYVLSSTLNRTDIFYPDGSITTDGGLPRINFSRGERRVGRSPLYFGVGSEYVTFLRSTEGSDGTTISDQGLTRFEVYPSVRVPFTRWQFLTVNSSVGWRGTYWSESYQTGTTIQVPEPLRRQFFDFNARVTGPVLTRIFQPSGNAEGQKFKHVIEPNFTIRRVTPFDIYDRIVKLDSTDYTVGNVTQFGYGLNNRLYAKKTVAREILTVSLNQSYYTDERAALTDQQYQNNFVPRRASKFSPVALLVRTSPSDKVQTDFRTEWDPKASTFLSFAATGTVNTTHLQASGQWSQQRVVPAVVTQPVFTSTHFLNAGATLRTAQNKFGWTYAFNYDLLRDTFLQQRYFAYYNAQCCGVLVEYQIFNYAGGPVANDKRFNVSFTLAGIGTFSNFLGAFGGMSSR
jgi:LPS-assembly protein